MPTYEYACRNCGSHLEVVQSFSDDPLRQCPTCAGPLRKVFGSIGITFKGSGFYKTDSRSPAPTKVSADGGGETTKAPAADGKEPKKETKKESTSADSGSSSPAPSSGAAKTAS